MDNTHIDRDTAATDAEAVYYTNLGKDAECFVQDYIGTWPTVEAYVENYLSTFDDYPDEDPRPIECSLTDYAEELYHNGMVWWALSTDGSHVHVYDVN